MKKALVLTLMLVLGLSLSLVAQTIGGDFVVGDLSGSWDTEFSIGYTDVVLSEEDFTVTVPGQSLTVTGQTVYIPDQTITIETSDGTYYDTISFDPILIGPYDVVIPSLSCTVVDGTAAFPGWAGTVIVAGMPVTFNVLPVLGVPMFPNWVDFGEIVMTPVELTLDASCEFVTGSISAVVHAEGIQDEDDKDEAVTLGSMTLSLNGDIAVVDASWLTQLLAHTWVGDTLHNTPSTDSLTLEAQDIQTDLYWSCTLQELIDGEAAIAGFTRLLDIDGGAGVEEVLITYPAFSLAVTCSDMTTGTIVISGWTGTGQASWGENITSVLADITVTLTLTEGTVTTGWTYFDVLFTQDGVDWLLNVELPPRTFTLVFTDLCGEACPTIDFDLTGNINLFNYDSAILVPGQEISIIVDGQTVTFTVPPLTCPVTGTTATFPGYTYTIEQDSVTIPDKTVTINVDGEEIEFDVLGGTYNVSEGTTYVQPFTFTVPGFNQTILDVVTLGVESTLTVDYVIGGWTFGSVLVVDETGMTALDFSAGGALGAFSFSSSLGFDPALVAFEKWNVVSGVSIAGVTFGANFTLIPNNVTLVLSGLGVSGDVSVGADITFGVAGNEECDLNWAGIVITAGFPFVCADIAATLTFDCEGFSSIMFEADGIAVQSFPWLTIDADLTFTTAAKTLVISPDFSFGTGVCFDLYMDLGYSGSGPLTIEGFTIYGIKIVGIFNGVTFTGLSSFDEVNYNLVMNPYWEVYTIATTDDGCCGPFAFDVSLYFLEGGVRLFDIAYLEANVSLQVASQLEFTTGVELDINDETFTLWTIGLNVDW